VKAQRGQSHDNFARQNAVFVDGRHACVPIERQVMHRVSRLKPCCTGPVTVQSRAVDDSGNMETRVSEGTMIVKRE
jgi:hypothetical protein